jgi:DNA-binding MarR family transcriptional regulator
LRSRRCSAGSETLTRKKGAYTLIFMTVTVRPQQRAQAAMMGSSCACFNLRKAARAVTQLYDSVLRPSGLRTTQLTLLMLLRGRGPLTISELASASMTDRTTLTRNLAVLQQRKLVHTSRGSDSRTRVVELTPAGNHAASAAFPLWEKAQSLITSRIGQRGLERLLAELSAAVHAASRVLE